MRTSAIHPAHCPCRHCRPPYPGQRATRRAHRLLIVAALLAAALIVRLL